MVADPKRNEKGDLDMNPFWELVLSALRVSTPLVFAAMGGLLSERSGVVHIALEGFLLVGAFASATGAYFFHSPWIGALIGMGATSVFALIYAFLVVPMRADQIVAGTAMNFLAFGLVPLLCKHYFDATGASPSLELADRFAYQPLWLMGIVVIAIEFYLRNYRSGLRLTVAGEKPAALATAGVSVAWVRMRAVILSGLLAGFGGATLSLFLSSSFSKGMTAGRGFMALAALIFGKWRPVPTLFGCLFFGLADAVQIRLQGASLGGVQIPVQFVQVLPYAITVIVLAGWVGRSRAPAALGRPFVALIPLVILSTAGMSACNRSVETIPATPILTATPVSEKPVAHGAAAVKTAFTAAERETYFREFRSVVFGESPETQLGPEDLGQRHAWMSGASLEGVVHGYLVGPHYRKLESRTLNASNDTIRRFCSLLPVRERCEDEYVTSSNFKLRRLLAEYVIHEFSRAEHAPDRTETKRLLGEIFARLETRGVDLGNHWRNSITAERFGGWVSAMFESRAPEVWQDQILWELLNRALRILPARSPT